MHWYNLSAFICLNSTSLNTHAPCSQSWRFPSFLPLLLSFVSARQLSGSASAKAFKPARTNGHTHTIGQTFVPKKYNVSRSLIQHAHVVRLALSPRFHHPFFQQPRVHTAPCCVTCLTGETKRSGTEASICAWLIIHPAPHPPHCTHGCTCSEPPAISPPQRSSCHILAHTSSSFLPSVSCWNK